MSRSYKAIVGEETVEDFIISRPPLELVKKFLKEQPGSFEGYFSTNEVLELVRCGNILSWVQVQGGEPVGMALFEIVKYGQERQSIRILFVSCRNFFALSKMWDHLEQAAQKAGILFIEANASEEIAAYAVKKKGFTSPSRYIVKTLTSQREN